MAQKIKHTIRLGIFVTVGAILFTLSVYSIGNRQNLFGKRYRISTLINNAYGLQVGNNVRYTGITVGSVERISFRNDSTLKVDMILDDEVKDYIKKDAIASISTDGLVGNVIVNITPGSGNGRPINNGDIIESYSRTDPNDLLNSLGNTNENIALLSLNLLEITEKINDGEGTVSRLIGDAQMANEVAKSLSNMQTVTKHLITMSEQLNYSIKQISEGNGLLPYLLHDNTIQHQMESFISNLDSLIIEENKPVMANLKTASEDVTVATNELKIVLETLNKGEGSATTILRDTAVAQDLKDVFRNLNEGTARFNENMEALKHNFLFKKYFKKQEKERKKQEKKK
jgi:phospholipid/cholesterol/gamma-HCH transport system substrate-binding protein